MRLIHAPHGLFICAACVGECVAILDERDVRRSYVGRELGRANSLNRWQGWRLRIRL